MKLKAYMVSPKGKEHINQKIKSCTSLKDTAWEQMVLKLKISGNLIEIPLDSRAEKLLDELEPMGWHKIVWKEEKSEGKKKT